MAYNVAVTPGSGATVAADDIGGGILAQRVKVVWGVDGTGNDTSATNPMPVAEVARGSALGKGGITSAATAATLVASNTSRQVVEVSNGGGSGVWLAFGSTAVAGQGTYLPSKATGYWPTTAAVSVILESGGSAGAVGYTEW